MESKIVSKEISPNIYWVKKENDTLLYAPLKSKAIKGWGAHIAKGLIGMLPNVHKEPKIVSLPTTVTLDLTHNCSLSCVYCSVDSGKDKTILSFDIAQTAIDFIIKNAIELGVSSIGIVLGGGGEPTLAWKILTQSIEYTWLKADEFNITPQILVATGGILEETKAKWLAKNTTHIALSFDGPEIIQNTHRPLCNKRGSFNYVAQTAKLFKELNTDFSIRAAISDLNPDLVELVEFFSQFKPRFLNFQPIVVCGRCHITGWRGLEPNYFIEQFKQARRIAAEKEISLIFPGARIDRIIPEMCHAYNGTGFVVSNKGLISACERVLSPGDLLADLFLYGKYVEGDFQINQQKLKKLKAIRLEKIPYCLNCFCRWHCCGGCLNDHLSQPGGNEDLFFTPRTNAMCYITREIVWDLILEEVSVENKT